MRSLEKTFAAKGGLRERMYQVRTGARVVRREEALSLLREIYREAAVLDRPGLLKKLETVAQILKSSW